MKLEISKGRKTGKYTNIWAFNHKLLTTNKPKIIIKKIRKYLQTIENKNTIYQNLWTGVESTLKGIFTMGNIYIKKEEISNQQPKFIP